MEDQTLQRHKQQELQFQKEETTQEFRKDASFREQDSMLANEFSEMDVLQSSRKTADLMDQAEKTEDVLNQSFILSDKKKIKNVRKEPKIVPEPKYVSLNKSFAVDSENDSQKMQDVKEAINRYHEVKGTATEGNVLATVIAACNRYISGKFSFFKFGRAAERLREVKEVRDEAKKEMKRLKEEENRFSEEEKKQRRKERIAAMKEKEDYYAPELNSLYQKKAESLTGEDKAKLKAKVKGLQFHYPAMDYDEAAKLVIRLEMTEGYNLGENLQSEKLDSDVADKLDDLVSKKALASAEKKRERDEEARRLAEEKQDKEMEEYNKMSLFEKMLDRYNPVARLFMRTFGRMYVERKVLEFVYMSELHAQGMDLKDGEKLFNDKNDDDEYNPFIL